MGVDFKDMSAFQTASLVFWWYRMIFGVVSNVVVILILEGKKRDEKFTEAPPGLQVIEKNGSLNVLSCLIENICL